MARFLKPLVRSGGYYPSRRWTPLVYPGGYTTANGGGQPGPALKTVSGSLIHITDALALPAESLTVAVDPVQEGSGDPSPDNVRPISGHTDADVTRTGKNLFNYTLYNDGTIFSANNDGSITVKTQDTRGWASIPQFYLEAGTYTFSRSNTSGVVQCWNATNSTWVVYFAEGEAVKSFTLSAPAVIQFRIGPQASSYPFNVNIQLELGNSASDFSPYVGTTYPIPLGTTVYGGTLDVVTGVLTVDRKMVDLGSLSWRYESAWGAFVSSLSDAKRVNSAQDANWISSIFYLKGAHYSGSTAPDLSVDCNSVAHSAGTFTIKDTEYGSDANAFKTAMSGVQFCYELATPTTIQLTPTQVELLQGENNIWSDGEMTLVYLADGNASDEEALNILLGGRYVNNHTEDEPTDREALDILLGR